MSVACERGGAVWVITIERASRRNAVDRETAQALAECFREFEADEVACVAVLYGAGGVFCAGADLKAISEGRGNRLEADGDGPMGPTRMQLSKVTIAAVEGYAVAGGLELAIWCDLRVAAQDAVFGVFCRRWGVPLIDGGTVRLPRLIGHGRAMDLILTGREVAAAEALEMGLINRVCPSGQALEYALGLAHELAKLPQVCMRGDKESAVRQWGLDEGAALALEFEIGRRALEREAVAGATRFARGAGRGGQPE
jgi:enoyl-CoA hydratase